MRNGRHWFRRGADEYEEAATELEARAARIGGLHNAKAIGNDQLVLSIAGFVRALGRASQSANRLTYLIAFVTVLGVVLTGINAWLVVVQIREAERFTRAQNNIALSSEFFNNSNNIAIMSALEESKPLWTPNGGKFSTGQIDAYLGDFDTIDAAFEDRVLSKDDLCDSFSYYVIKTFENKELHKYILDQRKVDPQFFGGLDELYAVVKKRGAC